MYREAVVPLAYLTLGGCYFGCFLGEVGGWEWLFYPEGPETLAHWNALRKAIPRDHHLSRKSPPTSHDCRSCKQIVYCQNPSVSQQVLVMKCMESQKQPRWAEELRWWREHRRPTNLSDEAALKCPGLSLEPVFHSIPIASFTLGRRNTIMFFVMHIAMKRKVNAKNGLAHLKIKRHKPEDWNKAYKRPSYDSHLQDCTKEEQSPLSLLPGPALQQGHGGADLCSHSGRISITHRTPGRTSSFTSLLHVSIS